MRVLIYAINGMGMGHLNRTLVLARAIARRNPKAEIRFVVGSPLFGLVREAGFTVTKVPDRHHALSFQVGRSARNSYLAGIFGCLLDDFRADWLLVDLAVDEGLFRAATRRGTAVALVLRKQRPSSLTALRRKMGIQRVRRFLIPHSPDESPLSQLPREWRARCRYLGPVVRDLDVDRITAVRARYAASTQKLVVATVGGGGFSESFATLAAVERLAREVPSGAKWVIVYGPYYPHEIPASDGDVVRLRFESQLLELLAGADAVICNAGYNTVRELEIAGTPALVVPLEGTVRDDQTERARAMAASGLSLTSSLDADELRTKLRALLEGTIQRREPRPPRSDLGSTALAALSRA